MGDWPTLGEAAERPEAQRWRVKASPQVSFVARAATLSWVATTAEAADRVVDDCGANSMKQACCVAATVLTLACLLWFAIQWFVSVDGWCKTSM